MARLGRMVAAVAALGVLAGCEGGGSALNFAGTPAGQEAFSPVVMRVHPLTHVEVRDGSAVLIAHVELKDRYGDTVKGLGRLSLSLSRPAGGGEARELAWEVEEMQDADRNARLFDAATRTYRLQLGVPAWVGSLSRGGEAGEVEWVRLRASLAIPTQEGEDRVLSSEYVITR